MVSLAIGGQINLTSTLWFCGIDPGTNSLAIASTVLASKMTIGENMSAGLGCSAIVFFLGATRTIHLIGSYTPVAIVRGIQLGAAGSLIKKAYDLVKGLQWTITADNWADNNVWVLLSFMFVILCYRTRIPSALILFIIGLIFALIRMFVTDNDSDLDHPIAGGHYPDTIIHPTPEEFRDGVVNAGLGQVPLTALNSVIALCALIDDLFPDRHATTSSVAMSVGAINLIGCWFGSMPVCHGSGGLAGQYRFGARSEVSVIFLGVCKLFLGILFGSSLVGLLQLFPQSILGVMLFISAIELGSAVRTVNNGVTEEWRQRENWTLLLITMGAILAFSNDGIGFLTGLVSAVLLSIQRLGPVEWSKAMWDNAKLIPYHWRHQGVLAYNKAGSDAKPVMDPEDPRNEGLPKPTAPSIFSIDSSNHR
ncbi:hypothetical protein BX666DRAFT_2025657 [Dichotomocladium elegans]|nr:hypothetical protein BX666DRAFT_2025657 [Dichotomocladium elegans]